ncbi:MAG: hybrid sensor histidine kinase/response regulator [Deltaproteobacteria bacterium]|nr:MAG: hybrid sensor histidine kinase/response regulator [Deltaproteobacteria bacterium]
MNPIVKEFLVESNENLSSITEEMTKYEKNPNDKEILNSIYRTIHTMKGSASFLGFKKLEGLTHIVENILDKLRESEISLTGELVDLFLTSFDACSTIVKDIEENESEGDRSFDDLIKRLKNYIAEPLDLRESDTVIDDDIVSDINLFNEKIMEVKQQKPELVATPVQEKSEPVKVQEKPKSEPSPAQEVRSTPKPPVASESSSSRSSISDTIRVNVSLLDKILNVVGELVLNRNQILQFSKMNDEPELNRLSHQLNVITTELQTDIMTTRMQPVGSVINKFERVVRDLARGQKKNITLEIQGQETELDKTLLEVIKDPLTHLVRNAIDHGIESPEVRINNGKSETGHLVIKAYHEGGQVIIEIADDGNGIPKDKILAKAVQKGLISEEDAGKMTDQKVLNLIFHPGFSTAEQVTNISGRGVGMDVVKSNIEKIGGEVDIQSVEGRGTTFKLKIPLTLAIVPALVVESGNETFAIPQKNLVELVLLEDTDVNNIEELHDQEFYRLRGELIPIFRLNKSLELCNDNEPDGFLNIIVLKAEGTQYGLIVDSILDTQEIVVKPLSRKLKCQNVYAGATIMGDGKVALILDAFGYFNMVDRGADKDKAVEELHSRDNSSQGLFNADVQELLLFELGDERPYAIPLCLINRLEEFKDKDVEWSGKQSLIRYRGGAMPLVSLDKSVHIEGTSDKLGSNGVLPCIVSTIRGQSFGFVVKRILDIARSENVIEEDNVDREELLGTTYVNDRLVTLVDVHTIVDHMGLGKSRAKHSLKGRVLLVEDSPLYQRVEMDLLEEIGLKVTLAENGKKALDILKSGEQFDLIVTDVEMPEMDGWELSRSVRGLGGKFSTIPIIAVTTRVSPKDLNKGKEVGFTEHLEKLNKQEMADSISRVLSA